jgi:hypothetical protein
MVYCLKPEMASLCLEAVFGVTRVMKQNFRRKVVEGPQSYQNTHMQCEFLIVYTKELRKALPSGMLCNLVWKSFTRFQRNISSRVSEASKKQTVISLHIFQL